MLNGIFGAIKYFKYSIDYKPYRIIIFNEIDWLFGMFGATAQISTPNECLLERESFCFLDYFNVLLLPKLIYNLVPKLIYK